MNVKKVTIKILKPCHMHDDSKGYSIYAGCTKKDIELGRTQQEVEDCPNLTEGIKAGLFEIVSERSEKRAEPKVDPVEIKPEKPAPKKKVKK